ncbi:MAG: S-layer homology domain-containing protein [Patescibacteria group bacterium]
MFKKFLAAVALIATFATSTASALSSGDEPFTGPAKSDGIISNFTVTNGTFSPALGEKAVISYKLSKDAVTSAYVVSKDNGIVAKFSDYKKTVSQPAPATVDASFPWNGKVDENNDNSAALPNGIYYFKVIAYGADGVTVVGKIEQAIVVASVTSDNNPAPKVSNTVVSDKAFSAVEGEATDVSFEIDKSAYTKVVVKDGSKVIATLDNGTKFHLATEKLSVSWNGKDSTGKVVANKVYTISITASNDQGDTSEFVNVEVITGGAQSKGIIENFSLNPSKTWNPEDGELEINYELSEDASFVVIEAKKGNKVVEIVDDEFVNDEDYEETWDGTDDDGDIVDEGTWTITLRADAYTVSETIVVSYDKPDFVEAFVTKDSIDPTKDEFTNLVFKVDTTSNVTVEVYQGTNKEATLLKDEEVRKNKWYAVEFDGVDNNGDEVNEGTDWRFKITAESTADNDIDSSTTVGFTVAEDDVSDKKANITNDYTSPIIFDEETNSELVFNYDLDEDAEVYLAIYEGNSTAGDEEAELMDYKSQDAKEGHTVKWNVQNDDGKELDDGIYTYKLISKAEDGGSKETEIGRFVVGNVGGYTTDDDNDDEDDEDEDDDDDVLVTTCGGYTDTQFVGTNDYETCVAIEWATARGIFNGYADGSFGPYNNISRAEVLKVAFEAFDNVVILPSDGTKLGFSDTDHSAWYMPYIRTGKFYGMVAGYPDGTFKQANNVSRVEFLKFVLEASESFTGYKVPNYSFSYFADVDTNAADQAWFKNYAGVAYEMGLMNFSDSYGYGAAVNLNPAKPMTRGEVALTLYRMYNAGLLGFYDEMFAE